ncbi:TonB-dependent receptor [Chitinophaga polysaccharea]|uniref:SusC/RagA family TonB-linked outer membrane protein n=1 Tax=Chitinophaga polysaccharea TaxID=1293035 RepID=UPI001455B217|nr:TonB-dependent receptor [Chitinophaga polysaccharea]NLR57375.1 TonB-dependent receptor [Chitinophaga polysaccharea]
MKGKHFYLFTWLFMIAVPLCSPQLLFAQTAHEIKGTVLDGQNKAALPGVTVMVKGSTTGASTDAKGQFTIHAAAKDILVFSFIGYDKIEQAAGSTGHLNIFLQPSKTTLNETVVIGYGVVKKTSVTASVSKVENTNLDQMPAGRPEAALVGRLAGVNISQTRGTAGSAPLIRIRGAGSISAGNDPLIVIDGIPGGNLGSVNMNDVQSIEVLKDASSAAIYGSRAAGGVILVTMKKGLAGKAKFNFNGYAGLSKAIVHHDWLSGQEYYDYAVKYQNREFAWAGGDVSIPVWGDPRRPVAYQVSDTIRKGNPVNWQDAVLQTAPIQSYNLSASGGTDKVSYYVSGTYKDEKGTLHNTWFKTYGVRANVDVKASKVVSLGFMLSPSYSKRRFNSVDIANFAKYPSFVQVRRSDGTYPKARDYWGAVVSGQLNPMATLDGTEYYGATFGNLSDMYLKLNLAKGLSLRSSVGTNIAFNQTDRFQASWANGGGQSNGGQDKSSTINILNENVLSYTTTFKGGHDLSAIAGMSFQRNDGESSSYSAMPGSYNNDIIHTLNNALINPAATVISKSSWGLVSYFSRVNYAYKDKYLLSASIRTDGSSRFGPNSKWGYFPSASVAWRVKQEDFMKEINAITDLKLRASYGVTGNFNIGDFAYLGKMKDAIYAPNNTIAKGQAQANYGNPDLGWEKTSGIDLGAELSVLDNRLSFVFDYYNKRTNNLLYEVSVPITTGFASGLTNIGQVSNKGIELELTSRNIVGKFNWTTSFNFSKNKNRVEDLGGVNERTTNDQFGMSWILRVGEPMFSYYGYKTIGVLKDASDVANSAVLAGSKPGNPKYLDVDGSKTIDAKDKMILGNFQPKAIFGMVNNFSWNGFDLSVAMQASLGARIYNFENEYYQGALVGAMRRSLVATQWWSPTDPGDGKMPASALSTLSYQAGSDVYIEDASFLSIRNVNLGYTLPESLTRKLRVNNCRVYFSASNVLMLTKKGFHGYNPEGYTNGEISGINSKPGYNTGSEPINRVYALGFNFNF